MVIKNKYGHTWWGKEWLNAFSNIDIQNRLTHGKSYLNNSENIRDIVITGEGLVASVKSDKPKPYTVKIKMKNYTNDDKFKILEILNKNKNYISSMLLGKINEEFIDELKKNEIKIFPKNWSDIEANCDCDDWAVPCKHIVAVMYIIANKIDKNPFLIFEIHNYNIKSDLEKHGYDFSSSSTFINNPYETIENKKIEKKEKSYKKIDFSKINDIKNKIFSLLNENPLFNEGKDFKKILESYYDDISEKADSIIENKDISYSCKTYDLKDVDFYISQNFDYFLGKLNCNNKNYIFSVANLDRLMHFFANSSIEERDTYNDRVKSIYNIYNFSLVLAKNNAFVPEILFISKNNYRIRWIPALFDEHIKEIYNSIVENIDQVILKNVKFEEEGKIVYELTKMDQRLSNIESNNLKEYKYIIEKMYLERYIKKLDTILGKKEYTISQDIPTKYVLEEIYSQINITDLYKKESLKKISVEESINEIVNIFITYFNLGITTKKIGISDDKILKTFFYGERYEVSNFYESEIPENIKQWLDKLHITNKEYKTYVAFNENSKMFNLELKFKKNDLDENFFTIKDVFTDKNYEDYKIDILKTVGILSEIDHEFSNVLMDMNKTSISFSIEKLSNIYFEIIPLLKMLGISIIYCNSLNQIYEPTLEINLDIENIENKEYSYNDLEKEIKLIYKIMIDNKEILKKEFTEMSKYKNSFIKYENKYVYISEEKIKKIKVALKDKKISSAKMLMLIISKEYEGFKVNISTKLEDYVKNLFVIKEISLPKNLNATLRPYQKRGYEWLYRNYKAGFGSILADDMGLGKTIQIITLLQKLKEEKRFVSKKTLIVVPTTLMSNWENEITKFSKNLKYYTYYGNNKDTNFKKVDIVITTYTTLRMDYENLKDIKWRCLIIDEAQNIKNSDTSQTKILKQVEAESKIAITGTPVENRLTEYWSIFDFINEEYLGNLNNFKKTFATPIEIYRNSSVLKKLKKITEPFILRRLKTEKNIISDLPDKIEIDKYVKLSKHQKELYNKVYSKYIEIIEGNVEKKIHIFSAINDLKKICNHPNHYYKSMKYNSDYSGKTKILMELLENIYLNSEKVIIFTQYKEMGIILKKMIEDKFQNEVLFLHGGLNVKSRNELLEKFQNETDSNTFILSLKAGGTGLNLTSAKYVIHFDLWWNPAIESQATDRAFRIGQEKDVIVYRLITKGTFEEKINETLKNKKEISDIALANNEKWIGDYSVEELREFFSLTEGNE
ncbi:MAG: DEAD/DEAH box helicase [Fusobacteria bacterium]|nr:DEAD/DEAH box helicase [Fusobacteriota bacterium]